MPYDNNHKMGLSCAQPQNISCISFTEFIPSLKDGSTSGYVGVITPTKKKKVKFCFISVAR